MSEESPVVQEVRDRAMKISERFGHDLHRYCQFLRERERKNPQRVVSQITVVRPSNPPKLAKP
jgi:hypothetical protein